MRCTMKSDVYTNSSCLIFVSLFYLKTISVNESMKRKNYYWINEWKTKKFIENLWIFFRVIKKMKSKSEENLISPDSDPEAANDTNVIPTPYDSIPDESDVILTPIEKKFLLCAERGDCAGVRR